MFFTHLSQEHPTPPKLQWGNIAGFEGVDSSYHQESFPNV